MQTSRKPKPKTCPYLEVDMYIGGEGLRPDVAGWRMDRHPAPPQDVSVARRLGVITVAPDWLCEVLSNPRQRVRHKVVDNVLQGLDGQLVAQLLRSSTTSRPSGHPGLELRASSDLAKVYMMDTEKTATYEAIVKAIHGWPPEQRFNLVQDVLKTLAAETERGRRPLPTLDEALGLLASDRPAPSDAEVDVLLDERRMRKYG